MNVVSFDLATAGKDGLTAAIDAVFGHEIVALHLHDSSGKPFEVTKTPRGKYDVRFRWLEALGQFTPFGTTEVAGASYVDDFAGHLDYRPADVMNVHATESGRARADFAPGLADSFLDEDKQVLKPLVDLYEEGHDILSIELQAGNLLCFCGGAVVHQFTSQSQARRSYIRNFRQG